MVFVIGSGTWNEETAQVVHDDIIRAAKEICQGPWAMVMEIDNWHLATPEAGGLIKACSEWCRANKLTHSAMVASGSQLKSNILAAMLAELQSPGHQRKRFDTKADAMAWLAESGFINSQHI